MASTTQTTVRDVLRETGPLTIDELVTRVMARQPLTSKNPRLFAPRLFEELEWEERFRPSPSRTARRRRSIPSGTRKRPMRPGMRVLRM